jgi:NitT/TauT family transport system substrate-binding protein
MLSVRIPTLCLLAALMLSGCGRQPAPAEKSDTGRLRRVVLQTDWFPQAEHGGFYQALAKGYYREAGLDVEIRSGGNAAGIKLPVAKGDVDFGMYRSDDLIVAASRGLPLIIVAATLQHDPQALLVHAESPVREFRDLAGRAVTAPLSMTWIPFIQKKYGIHFDLKPANYALGAFLADRSAIQQCMVTNEPFFAGQHGVEVRTLPLGEAGYDSYHTIFCRRELVRAEPALVRAFVAASLRGWRDYVTGDPAPAHGLILGRNAQMTVEQLAFSRGELIRRGLVSGDGSRGEAVGELSLQRLSAQIDVLLDLKLLDAPVAVGTIATREFLPPCRGEAAEIATVPSSLRHHPICASLPAL